MSKFLFAGAMALAAVAVSAPALADDSGSYTRATSAERARDKAITTNLNRQALASAQARDARYAQGWADYRAYHSGQPHYATKARKKRKHSRR